MLPRLDVDATTPGSVVDLLAAACDLPAPLRVFEATVSTTTRALRAIEAPGSWLTRCGLTRTI
jgi:hypothetical protein